MKKNIYWKKLGRSTTARRALSRALTRSLVESGSITTTSAKAKYISAKVERLVNLVKVGETSGNLSQSLLYLSEELKKQRAIKRQVRAALIYPAVILVATIGITIFLTLFIFPKILPIFASLNIQLPLTTRIVIKILTFLQHYGLWTLGGLMLLGITLRVALAIEKLHFYFDKLLLDLPFVSKVIVDLTMTNFTRSMSVLLKSGMTLTDALEIAKGTFHNLYYRREIDRIVDAVRRGETMARYLGAYPRLFPPMLTGMIKVGETTGNLQDNLLYLSDYYETEVTEAVKGLTTILEPFLLLTMGVLVGFIAVSIITPIYSITQGLTPK